MSFPYAAAPFGVAAGAATSAYGVRLGHALRPKPVRSFESDPSGPGRLPKHLRATLARPERYDELRRRVAVLLADADDWLAGLAHVAASVYEWLPDPSWAGVCTTAVREHRSQVVVDVHAFPGHIACGPASRWEIVVPIRDADGGIVAVLDLDSDRPGTFDELDRAGLEMLVTDLALRIDRVAAGARPGTLDRPWRIEFSFPVRGRVREPGSRRSER